MPTEISPRLHSYLSEFLPTVRVGVDFGEHAGGIAVVRGTEILHAETYLDFHEATLEQRRILRRGRRSRRAKKMRLARLRSWVLRQRLPNGERLPDPYAVMQDRALMSQPGVYKQKGADPESGASWIAFVKAGKADAAGFVKALTLIFAKRGYRWDAIDPERMDDARLRDFLLTARIPADDAVLADQVGALIERRRKDPDSPSRGRHKVAPEELEALFHVACDRGKRPPRPRLAEHRSVKESELRAMVDGFTRAVGLSEQERDCWKRELVGLLNKVLRPARFDNRLKSGCAWCGKATPRKSKVRQFAYFAAVNNLRIRENFCLRPLADQEKKVFLDWWEDPDRAPGMQAIENRLRKMNSGQKGMARQFYDLLKNDKPAGRTSLCYQHLRMAAENKTMKDAGVDWQTVAPRKAPNPCRERRDQRVLHRLEQVLFKPGEGGRSGWRFGQVSYITLEVPEPETERAAKGTQKERKILPLKDRLAQETNGCVYQGLDGCGGEIDKDHIFPRSRGGPDVQVNLVSACMAHNKEKGNHTPFEWFGNDAARWGAWKDYVVALKIPERKKHLLLNEAEDYPEGDPTALARVGARPRQFVVALAQLFRKHEMPAPRLDYHLNEPLIQRIPGTMTTGVLRLSWCRKENGAENFPYPKDRTSLFNHAEDAALLAACPPHTWRELARCHTADRPNWKGEKKPRPGLMVPELAPDWVEFLRTRRHPLVRILGRYPVTWKTKFADLSFWRDPEDLDSSKIKRSKPVKDLKRPEFKNIASSSARSMVESVAEAVALGDRGTIAEAEARKLVGAEAKAKALKNAMPAAVEKLETEHPEIRRVQVYSQKGGTILAVKPVDGPRRKVQIKPASEGAIVWQLPNANRGKKAKIGISLLRPRPLAAMRCPRVDPVIPEGAEILGQLHRHQIIWLDAHPGRPRGFYRLTKFQENGITIQPEEEVPAEIARRQGVSAAAAKPNQEDQEAGAAAEEREARIVLGKADLLSYFTNKKRGTHAAGA